MHCALCFRTLEMGHRWTTCSFKALRDLMRLDHPPFEPIVLAAMEAVQVQHHAVEPAPSLVRLPLLVAASTPAICMGMGTTFAATAALDVPREALLCDYCALFMKERSVLNGDGLLPGRKHGMQVTIEHILSGGCVPAPSRSHFQRCLEVLGQPEHPFMALAEGALADLVHARKYFAEEEGGTSMVRWVLDGMPRIFQDPLLAKHVRRWLAQNPTWLERLQPLPDACRFCCAAEPVAGSPSSYAGALLGADLEATLRGIEASASMASSSMGLLVLCPRCHRASAISFQFDRAVRERLGLAPAMPSSSDAYYARLIARFRLREEKKKNEASAESVGGGAAKKKRVRDADH